MIIDNTNSEKLIIYLNSTELTQDGTLTPTNPVDVNVIKGENNITITNSDNTEEQNYPITLDDLEYCKIGDYADQISNEFESNNLFDYHWFGTSKDILWQYYYETLGQNDFRAIPIYIGIGNYATFSTNVPQTSPSLLYAINDINLGSSVDSPLNSTVVRTIQANSEGYVYLGFVNTRQYYTDVVNGTYYIQIEIGSTATEYMPYGITKGEWYLKKNINKVTFDGSESGWVWSDTTRYAIPIEQAIERNAFCNYFTYVNYRTYDNTPSPSFGINPSMTHIGFHDKTITSLNAFKTWLSTHNTNVYYPLATPTYIHISHEDYPTLKTELDNLYNNAKSYNGQTNITQTNDDLPFNITYELISDTEGKIRDVVYDINEFLRKNL